VAKFINVRLAGALVINPAGGTSFSLTGKSELTILNQTVLAGELSINDKGLFISGNINLFPGVRAVTATGKVSGNITKDGFGLAGNVDLAAGGVTIINGMAAITHAGIAFTGSFLGSSATFSALARQGSLQIEGGIKVSVPIKADIGPINSGLLRVADKIKLDLTVSCGMTCTISKSGFTGSVSASPSPRVLGQTVPISFTLSIVPADVQALEPAILKEIESAITKDFKKFFGDAGTFLTHVGNGFITFSGNTLDAVSKVLKDGYNQTANQAAQLLKGAGYAADEVGKSLKGAYQVTAETVAKALKGAGYTASQVGGALKGTFTNSVDAAAKALKGAGYTASQVGGALKGTFTSSTDAAAKALKGAGYTASQVGGALKGTFTNSVDTAAKALKSAGYAADDVANVMKNTFGASAKQVAQFMKDTWGLGDKAVNGLLKGAGYAASEIDSVMKSLFGWFTEVFNPSHW
jgi:Flp pilus assembly pilin Flp